MLTSFHGGREGEEEGEGGSCARLRQRKGDNERAERVDEQEKERLKGERKERRKGGWGGKDTRGGTAVRLP